MDHIRPHQRCRLTVGLWVHCATTQRKCWKVISTISVSRNMRTIAKYRSVLNHRAKNTFNCLSWGISRNIGTAWASILLRTCRNHTHTGPLQVVQQQLFCGISNRNDHHLQHIASYPLVAITGRFLCLFKRLGDPVIVSHFLKLPKPRTLILWWRSHHHNYFYFCWESPILACLIEPNCLLAWCMINQVTLLCTLDWLVALPSTDRSSSLTIYYKSFFMPASQCCVGSFVVKSMFCLLHDVDDDHN